MSVQSRFAGLATAGSTTGMASARTGRDARRERKAGNFMVRILPQSKKIKSGKSRVMRLPERRNE